MGRRGFAVVESEAHFVAIGSEMLGEPAARE